MSVIFKRLVYIDGKWITHDILEEETLTTTVTTVSLKTTSCIHEYKEYIGFTERYNYCTKCNEKQNNEIPNT